MRKHLYSLIGFNDPTSAEEPYELGSILHILSNEKFDKVYLFRTHDVMQQSNYRLKENRLKEIIKSQFNIPVIVSDFAKQDVNTIGKWKDIFHDSILNCMKAENFDDDILWYINFEIGTPIMISALTHAILTINQPIFAIYPNEIKVNDGKRYEVSKKQIVSRMEQAANKDVIIASIKQLQEIEIKSQIERLINIHDYHAASILLSEFSSTYFETLKNMCDGADCLTKLKIDEAKKYFQFTPLHSVFKNKIPLNIFELIIYVNNLEAKCKDKEYFDFVMRTSPLLYELCLLILVNYTHFPKNAISKTENYSTEVISKKNLKIIPTEFKKYFEGYFKKNPNAEHVVVTTPLLVHLISYQLTSAMSITNELHELRNFEEKIRNEFAHVFSDYTDEYIYSRTQKHPDEILELYKKVIRKIAFEHVKDDSLFSIYDTVNQTILDYIEIYDE